MNTSPEIARLRIPAAPRSIQKGSTLGDLLDREAIDLAFELCRRWLKGASAERNWLIRHAVRHPAKKGVKAALQLRKLAK